MTTLLKRAAWAAAFLLLAAAVWWLMPVLPHAKLSAGSRLRCISPDGHLLATCQEGRLTIWDMATAQIVAELPGEFAGQHEFTFSLDGHWLTESGSGFFRLWELPELREVIAVPISKGATVSPAFSPDGKWLAFRVEGLDHAQQLKVWDLAQRCERTTLPGSKVIVPVFLWSPDGNMLAFESAEPRPGSTPLGQLHVWVAESGLEKTLLDNDPAPLRVLAFSPDGRSLASGERIRWEWNGTHEVKLWDLSAGKPSAPWQLPGGVWELRYTGDGSWLLAMSSVGLGGGQLIVIDPSAAPPAGMTVSPNCFPRVTHSPDGRLMASGGFGPGAPITILELPDARERAIVECQDMGDDLIPMGFTRDGELLAVSAATAQPMPTLNWLSRMLGSAVPSPDRHLDLHLYVCESRTGKVQGAVPVGGPGGGLLAPDGRTLVALTPDNHPALWDVPLHKPWPRIVAWWALLAAGFGAVALWRQRRAAPRAAANQ
jgi:WD40 repeat protein